MLLGAWARLVCEANCPRQMISAEAFNLPRTYDNSDRLCSGNAFRCNTSRWHGECRQDERQRQKTKEGIWKWLLYPRLRAVAVYVWLLLVVQADARPPPSM